jgi:phage repressor protein C with HTH and peptisase S24 domain
MTPDTTTTVVMSTTAVVADADILPAMDSLGHRVKVEREARGWSQAELAKRVVRAGAKSMSQAGIHKLESKGHSEPKTIVHLAKALGLTPSWLQSGRGEKSAMRALSGATAADATPPERHRRPAGDTVEIAELEVHAGAGMGVDGDTAIMANEDASSVVGIHTMPAASFREAYGVSATRIKIIPVKGNSMEPKLWPGQRVMVDIEDKTPSPPGIFVVWDGLALVLKYVEVVANSEPLRVRISSANAAFLPYERTLGEAYINGRVIGVWARM